MAITADPRILWAAPPCMYIYKEGLFLEMSVKRISASRITAPMTPKIMNSCPPAAIKSVAMSRAWVILSTSHRLSPILLMMGHSGWNYRNVKVARIEKCYLLHHLLNISRGSIDTYHYSFIPERPIVHVQGVFPCVSPSLLK